MIKKHTQSQHHYSRSVWQAARHAATTLALSLSLTLLSALPIHAAQPELAADYPERYTVVEGDTLWGISGRFLSDPWRWPEVWQGNPQVENPDLIYPGDVLVMTFVDGRPVLKALRRETVKLSPSPRSTPFSDAIPPIDPSAIEAYINSPLVTDSKELKNAGYIVEALGNRLVAGKYDQVYARSIKEADQKTFRVFRPGRTFVHPETKEDLGYEAVHVGEANMLRAGDDVSRLVLTKTYMDVNIKDRLRPVTKISALPFFYPKAPDDPELRGVILPAENEVTELGAMSVVAVGFGEREGVKAGDVFRILSQKRTKKDPFNGKRYQLPEEKVGLALVFRTFEKVSYALITDSSQEIQFGDSLVSPDKD